MLDQIAFDVSSSVVVAVMIEIHVCSEPSGLFDTELTRPPTETLTIKRGKRILFIFIYSGSVQMLLPNGYSNLGGV